VEQERQLAGLMQRAQQGDQEAYGELLARLTTFARRYVRGRSGAASWLDDVVQETLMTVHRVRHTCDTSRAFAPWFYAILSSRLIDVARRERRIAGREATSGDLPERSTADAEDARDDIDVDAIRAAVRALPARQAEVIDRLKFHDESVRDVATTLGMSESAVKVTAHRGYKVLRRWLGGSRGAH